MNLRKIILFLILGFVSYFIYSCKTEEIILHGEITGTVTDTATSQPLQAIPVKLNPTNDTTSTALDGKYLFKSLIPGDFTVEVSKIPYATSKRSTTVSSANTTEVNFALHKIQYPEISTRHLDFGFDSTLKSFTIRNTGAGKLNYSLFVSQDWITVRPNIGEATTETDTFKVTINRTGLSEEKHVEFIEVDSHVGFDIIRDTIHVYINGIMDKDTNYYGIVTIGTQTWMAENLNSGKQILSKYEQQNNSEVEKYCYRSDKNNCDIYGGLYQWGEAMQYNTGTTQGVCPDGWHIPTYSEWMVLKNFAGQYSALKLKEAGTVHWVPPNDGTDEYGFTALPAGFYSGTFMMSGEWTIWWSSSELPPGGTDNFSAQIRDNEIDLIFPMSQLQSNSSSVRCIKNP